MNTNVIPLNDITRDAVVVLSQTIGVVNTFRFVNQFSTGFGDYTEERKKIFYNKSLDDLVSEIEQSKKI